MRSNFVTTIVKTIKSLISVFVLLAAVPVLACIDPPETELEEIYCKIKAKGKGDTLPDFQAFRRNPPSTQALLLRRPAKKLGITLPDTNANAKSAHASKPVIESQAMFEPPVTADTKREEPKPRETASTPAFSLQQMCQLQKETITCGSNIYELQINLANRLLPESALSKSNILRLPARESAEYLSMSNHEYLSYAYPIYIEKMVDIGLADATMSFTKFALTYRDIDSKGGSFSKRFAEMYELLKKERQTNAVKSRYNNLYPESLALCMSLNSTFIVCDNVKQNWIYKSR